jgi:GNAT superfamily N-acetyltransferase
MSLLIRGGDERDAEAIAFLHWQGWRTAYASFIPSALMGRRTLGRRLDEWRARLSADPGMTFVAERAGIVRGFVHATPPRSDPVRCTPDPSWELEIGYLYVDPGWHGTGLGRELLRAVAGQAQRESLRRCVVVAFAGNPYRTVYERLGARFAGIEAFELEGWPGEDAYYVWDDFPATFGL